MKKNVCLLTTVFVLLFAHGCISSSRAQKHNVALNKCLDYGSPSTYKIAYLLSRHDYKALDQWFETMLQQYKQDAQYECYLDKGFAAFNQRNMPLKDLDSWVAATGSATAYAARGAYKAKQGFGARGVKFFSETRTDQINEMQRSHDEATKDLQTAISKNPSLMPAYTWLIKMAKASDMPYDAKQILQKAEENDKRSYSVRDAYIGFLSWRGSIEEIADFANQESHFADLNPRLWSLQGTADGQRAFILHRERNYASAVELYTSALKFGDNPRLLRMRSLCYSALNNKELSRADIDKFRYYVSRDMTDYVPGEPADVAGLKFEVSEKSYIDTLNNKNKVRSYLVLPVEQLTPFPDDLSDVGKRDSKRNIDKIELMVMRLGSECVERTNLNSILNERKISPSNIANENAQTVGKLMSADAVVITTNSQKVYHATRTYVTDIDIKAVSVVSGNILWQSHLNGSVSVDASLTNLHELIYDTLETKLYNALEDKLQKVINQ